MTYEVVENFAAGLDIRKSPLTAPGGTLTKLINATLTPGGEILKRRAFIDIGSVAGSFGLAATESTLYIFGRNVDPPLPAWAVPGVAIKGQKIPNADPNLQQTDYDSFDGKIYLSTRTGAGALPVAPTAAENPHYYDGVLTTTGSGKGFYVRTYQSKIYAVTGKYLYFSAVNDPMIWDTGTGHGFINLSLQDADSERLTSLEVYYDKLAIFSTEAIQVWAVDPDPAQNAYVQLLRGVGTNAPRSTTQYGSGDVLYLDASGIRSMKAKDSSNSAAVSDIGSPIDPLLQELYRTRGAAYMNSAISLLEPTQGRFWMVFPDRFLALSYFPGPKVTAWSEHTLPELGAATVTHAIACGGRIFFRSSDDRLYLYGGLDNTVFNNCGVTVRLPYLSGKKPGHNKLFEALDLTIEGAWEVRVSYDFNNPEAEEVVGAFTQSTWNAGRAELTGYGSHISIRLYNTSTASATLANLGIHYQVQDDEA